MFENIVIDKNNVNVERFIRLSKESSIVTTDAIIDAMLKVIKGYNYTLIIEEKEDKVGIVLLDIDYIVKANYTTLKDGDRVIEGLYMYMLKEMVEDIRDLYFESYLIEDDADKEVIIKSIKEVQDLLGIIVRGIGKENVCKFKSALNLFK